MTAQPSHIAIDLEQLPQQSNQVSIIYNTKSGPVSVNCQPIFIKSPSKRNQQGSSSDLPFVDLIVLYPAQQYSSEPASPDSKVSKSSSREEGSPSSPAVQPELEKGSDASNQHASTLSDIFVEDDHPEVKEVISKTRQMADGSYLLSTLFLVLNTIASILGLLIITRTIGYLIFTIVVLVVVCLLIALVIFRKGDYNTRKQWLLDLGHLVSLVIYLIFEILKVESIIGFAVIGLVLGGLILIVDIFPTKSNQNTFLKLAKFIFWVQLLLFSLKIDGVSISWPLAFFVLNFLAFVNAILSFMMFIFWISSFSAPITPLGTRSSTVCGTSWYFMQVLTFVTWSIVLISVEELFPSSTMKAYFPYLFAGNIALCLLGLLFGLVRKRQVLLFLKERAFNDITRHKKIDQLSYKTSFKLLKPVETYLFKLSCTYFCSADEGLTKGNQDNLKIHQKEIKQAKHGHHHAHIVAKPIYKPIELKPIEDLKPNLECKHAVGELPDKSMYELGATKEEESAILASLREMDLSCDDVEIIKKVKTMEKEEERESGEKRECVVCCEKEADVVIMKCGHGGLCISCAVKGWRKSDKCHICRGTIEYMVRTKYVKGVGVYKVLDKITKNQEKRKIEL